jgi:hypothetical protein
MLFWDVTEERFIEKNFMKILFLKNLLLETNKSGVYKHIEWHDKIY